MPDREAVYRITIEGQLKSNWREWFGDLYIKHTLDSKGEPITILESVIIDQAALRGLLTKVWDLGLVVIALRRISAVDR